MLPSEFLDAATVEDAEMLFGLRNLEIRAENKRLRQQAKKAKQRGR